MLAFLTLLAAAKTVSFDGWLAWWIEHRQGSNTRAMNATFIGLIWTDPLINRLRVTNRRCVTETATNYRRSRLASPDQLVRGASHAMVCVTLCRPLLESRKRRCVSAKLKFDVMRKLCLFKFELAPDELALGKLKILGTESFCFSEIFL